MLPLPTEPWLSAPGLALAMAISSFTERAGNCDETMSTGATELTMVMGANAFAVSNGMSGYRLGFTGCDGNTISRV
jgi:hypothetical protein